MTVLLNQDDLYRVFKTQFEGQAPQVSNWRDGSIANAVAGAAAVTMQELSFQINQSFLKLFLQTAKE